MIDLYQNLDLPIEADVHQILDAIDHADDVDLVRISRYVLLDDNRRRKYDRYSSTLRSVSEIRNLLGITNTVHWENDYYIDFVSDLNPDPPNISDRDNGAYYGKPRRRRQLYLFASLVYLVTMFIAIGIIIFRYPCEDSLRTDAITLSTEPSVIYGAYPELSQYVVSAEYFTSKTRTELRVMRNEIYARHGMIFSSEDLNMYFNQMEWYRPSYRNVNDKISDVERKNLNKIVKYEESITNN
jgi:hypothetical protein